MVGVEQRCEGRGPCGTTEVGLGGRGGSGRAGGRGMVRDRGVGVARGAGAVGVIIFVSFSFSLLFQLLMPPFHAPILEPNFNLKK